MTKEELINFISSIDFKLATNMTLTFIKEIPNKYMDEEEKYNIQPKTITFQKDYESLINDVRNLVDRKFEYAYQQINELERKIENDKDNK